MIREFLVSTKTFNNITSLCKGQLINGYTIQIKGKDIKFPLTNLLNRMNVTYQFEISKEINFEI